MLLTKETSGWKINEYKESSWVEQTTCRNPSFSHLACCCCSLLLVMVTASDWWLFSVAGLSLWLSALLLAYFPLTYQQLTQSISALLNPFGSQGTPAKAYNFKARWVIDSSREGTADKSNYLQRSSKDCFHHKGREEFRKKCRSTEEVCRPGLWLCWLSFKLKFQWRFLFLKNGIFSHSDLISRARNGTESFHVFQQVSLQPCHCAGVHQSA